MTRRSFRCALRLLALGAAGCGGDDTSPCRDDAGEACLDASAPLPDGSESEDAQADAASVQDAAQDASSGDPDAAQDGGAGGPSIAELCATLQSKVTAWQNRLDGCCGEAASADRAYLLELVLATEHQSAEACVERLTDLTDRARVRYYPAAASGCSEAYLAQYGDPPVSCPSEGFDAIGLEASYGHGVVSIVQLAACRAAFAGTGQLGQPCDDTLGCVSGLRCLGEDESRSCAGPVVAGRPCRVSADCADAHLCVGADGVANGRVCRARENLPVQGGYCARSGECAVGYLCTGAATCTTPGKEPICVQ